jgi:hypothetical protein
VPPRLASRTMRHPALVIRSLVAGVGPDASCVSSMENPFRGRRRMKGGTLPDLIAPPRGA